MTDRADPRAMRQAPAPAQMTMTQRVMRRRPWEVVTFPLIFGMAVPIVLLDLCATLYQQLSFPLYGIPRVRRRDYVVIDRHRLTYLHVMRKLWCVYCGYANGVLAYVQEIAARTEHYWCPVRHARTPKGAHRLQKDFLPYGAGEDFLDHWFEMRSRARACEGCEACGDCAEGGADPGAGLQAARPRR